MPFSTYQKLAGKRVLVIGGSSGIGFAVAKASLAAGANVIVSSSSPDKVQAAVKKLRGETPAGTVDGYATDLSKPTVEHDLEALFQRSGKLDHIVLTACDQLALVPFGETELEVGVKYLNPGPASSITLTTGASAEKPALDWTLVAAYASGIQGMVRNLALGLKPVRVNAVSPGVVDTELWGAVTEQMRNYVFQKTSESMPTGVVGKPGDVAEAFLWLLKDKNVTGTIASTNSGIKLV